MNFEALPLHFVRPEWLWLLLALPLAWLCMRRRNARVDVWKGRIDPHLRPHVLEGGGRGDHRETRWPWLLALALAVLAPAIGGQGSPGVDAYAELIVRSVSNPTSTPA